MLTVIIGSYAVANHLLDLWCIRRITEVFEDMLKEGKEGKGGDDEEK